MVEEFGKLTGIVNIEAVGGAGVSEFGFAGFGEKIFFGGGEVGVGNDDVGGDGFAGHEFDGVGVNFPDGGVEVDFCSSFGGEFGDSIRDCGESAFGIPNAFAVFHVGEGSVDPRGVIWTQAEVHRLETEKHPESFVAEGAVDSLGEVAEHVVFDDPSELERGYDIEWICIVCADKIWNRRVIEFAEVAEELGVFGGFRGGDLGFDLGEHSGDVGGSVDCAVSSEENAVARVAKSDLDVVFHSFAEVGEEFPEGVEHHHEGGSPIEGAVVDLFMAVPAADFVGLFKDCDLVTEVGESSGSGEATDSGSDDDDSLGGGHGCSVDVLVGLWRTSPMAIDAVAKTNVMK